MGKIKRLKAKTNNFLYDHYLLKSGLHNAKGLFFATIAAFIFAFGFTSFITPGSDSTVGFKIVTGGVSGLSQNIAKIVSISGGEMPGYLIEAIGYSAFNLPLVIFAFFKIGKRFTILTAINVGLTSLFISLIPVWGINQAIANHALILEQPVARVLFGGMCTGISSALAFKGEISCGGIDIVSYYFSLRKSTSVGKYSMLINGFIFTLYSILIMVDNPSDVGTAVISLFFSIVYTLVANIVIDAINLRNKKVQLQFITKSTNLAKILITHFPHGATVSKVEGAYTHNEEQMIYMIISSFEMKKVVELARKVDPHVFITCTALIQVYGNFYIRPID